MDRTKRLEDAIKDLREALNLFVCNKYAEAFEFCQEKMNANPELKLPYLHVSAILRFVHGLLTLEQVNHCSNRHFVALIDCYLQKQLAAALDLLKKDCDLSASLRRKVSLTESFTSFFWKSNYEDYTDGDYSTDQLAGLMTLNLYQFF